jgi:short-subunit dehydrogenase
MEVKGKVAIVTGASGGIGLATAKLLSSRGAKVALVARSKDKLERLAKELPESLAVVTDISKIEDIARMVSQVQGHYGRIDILVNNAGQGYDSPIEQVDADIMKCIINLDFVGQVLAMKQVIPIMRKQGGGAILNVSSALALMHLPGMSIYAAQKAALAHISITAHEELGGDKIVVSVIYPYITLTDFEKNTARTGPPSWGDHEEGDEDEGAGLPFKPDTAEYVAEKILEGIQSGEAEIFVHDWMKPSSKPS